MSALVIDAGAALTLVSGGDGRSTVRDALRERILAGEALLVPTIFWIELIDALRQARGRRPSTMVEAIYELEQLGLETADVGRPGILAMLDAAGRGLTAAEGAYLVLAEASDADLLTASPGLAAVAGGRAMLVGRRRAARLPRPDRSWAGWKGAATYLRELRASL